MRLETRDLIFFFSVQLPQEEVQKERHAAAHRACRPLNSPFTDLLPGDLTFILLEIELSIRQSLGIYYNLLEFCI